MKLYTGTGDRGKTSLFSGERRLKSHARIESYGTLDELSACLGALAAAWLSPGGGAQSAPEPRLQVWSPDQIAAIQADLFLAGAWLATMPEAAERRTLPPVDPARSRWLEAAMDRMDAELPALRTFILPGGHPVAAWAHLARTVCRRAERRVVALMDAEKPATGTLEPIVVYLNRLSDYLFMLARWANQTFNVADRPWRP